jgi:hypothetical protein
MKASTIATAFAVMLGMATTATSALADGRSEHAERERLSPRTFDYSEYGRCNLWNYYYHPEECACDSGARTPFHRRVCRFERSSDGPHRGHDHSRDDDSDHD